MGYTEYKCDNCDDSYIGDYTDKAEHEYAKTLLLPLVPNTVTQQILA